MGLVNWVVEPAGVDAALAGIVEKAFHSSRTATGHAKRLLHASFHRDPREMIEEVMRAQHECMTSWEMEQANRAWDERREPRFYPPPSPGATRLSIGGLMTRRRHPGDAGAHQGVPRVRRGQGRRASRCGAGPSTR